MYLKLLNLTTQKRRYIMGGGQQGGQGGMGQGGQGGQGGGGM